MLRAVTWIGALAVLATSQAAFAQSDLSRSDVERYKNYFGVEAGYVFGFTSEHERVEPAQVETPVDADFSGGFTGALTFGRYIGAKGKWRVEGELSYLQNKFDDANTIPGLRGSSAGNGHLRAYTAMVNIYRDIPLNDRWGIFSGFGVGGVLIDPDYVLNTGGGPITDGTDLNFGAQGSAGVHYKVSDRTNIGIRYRYLWAGKYDFGPYEAEYDNHSLLAGLRYSFGPAYKPAPPPPPPAPAPPPPPPPPPPAEPSELLDEVLFRHDSFEITPASSNILDEVARIIRTRNITAIRLEGHTDSSGSAEYNQRLSQNRVVAVRDGLIARGVSPTHVVVSAKGETELRVPTGDGVRNQSNRWVRIFVRYD
jgi:outer membrane protein OmpA-like peptidoglycan-associated protein